MVLNSSLQEAFSGLLEQCFDGVAVWAPDPWRVVYSNAAFDGLMSGVPGVASGQKWLDSLEEASRSELVGLMGRLAQEGHDPTKHEVRCPHVRTVDGRSLELRLCQVERDSQHMVGLIVREAAPRSTCDSVAIHRRDPLTGLPDREYLLERITALLRDGNPGGRSFAVLFLDLDHFKAVNDEFGHLLGDDVLREAARRIADCVRDGDQVARYGGDEFVVIVDRISTADEVEPIVARIRAALSKPIALADGEVTLSATVGVALASEEHRTAEEMLSAADQAMYAAKRAS